MDRCFPAPLQCAASNSVGTVTTLKNYGFGDTQTKEVMKVSRKFLDVNKKVSVMENMCSETPTSPWVLCLFRRNVY